jgi:hypothetical protein
MVVRRGRDLGDGCHREAAVASERAGDVENRDAAARNQWALDISCMPACVVAVSADVGPSRQASPPLQDDKPW